MQTSGIRTQPKLGDLTLLFLNTMYMYIAAITALSAKGCSHCSYRNYCSQTPPLPPTVLWSSVYTHSLYYSSLTLAHGKSPSHIQSTLLHPSLRTSQELAFIGIELM